MNDEWRGRPAAAAARRPDRPRRAPPSCRGREDSRRRDVQAQARSPRKAAEEALDVLRREGLVDVLVDDAPSHVNEPSSEPPGDAGRDGAARAGAVARDRPHGRRHGRADSGPDVC